MAEAVIKFLIGLCILVAVVFVALYVFQALGLVIPVMVARIIWIVVGLIALLMLIRLLRPYWGNYIP